MYIPQEILWALSSTCKRILETQTTLHDDDWRLVEHDLLRFFFKFFSFFLGIATSRIGKKQLYVPRCHAVIFHTRLTHALDYVHYRGVTIDLQDCLVKQPSIFMPEKRGKGQSENTEDAERRKGRKEHAERSSFG